MGLWDIIRGAEKAQGGNYNPGIGKQQSGNPSLSASALSAFRGLGIGKKGGRE
jgi:hypothetical protein